MSGPEHASPGSAARSMPSPEPAARSMPSPDPAARPAPAQGTAAAPPQRPESLLQSLQGLLRELPGLVGDRVELLSLEVERAGKALAKIAVLVIAAALLAVTGWLALWGVVTGVLIALGAHWALALAIVLVINLGFAWWAVSHARKQLPLIGLPATRRHLTLSRSTTPRAPPAEPPVHERPHVPPPSAAAAGSAS